MDRQCGAVAPPMKHVVMNVRHTVVNLKGAQITYSRDGLQYLPEAQAEDFIDRGLAREPGAPHPDELKAAEEKREFERKRQERLEAAASRAARKIEEEKTKSAALRAARQKAKVAASSEPSPGLPLCPPDSGDAAPNNEDDE